MRLLHLKGVGHLVVHLQLVRQLFIVMLMVRQRICCWLPCDMSTGILHIQQVHRLQLQHRLQRLQHALFLSTIIIKVCLAVSKSLHRLRIQLLQVVSHLMLIFLSPPTSWGS
jgi:hypothetical protein